MADLTIKIKADGSDAQKGFKNVEQSVKDLSSKAESFGTTAKVAIGSFIGLLGSKILTDGLALIKNTFDDAIQAAANQELAIVKLNNSLKLNGEFSEITSQSFQKFADSLARTSQLEDDVILSQIAIAKSFGATNEQARLIIETAADMAFALDKDFGQTVLELSATLEGSAGRLTKIDGSIKDLGESGLKAGEAIKILNEKFKGSAQEGLNSYSGSMGQLKKAFGELLETFGTIITSSSLVKSAISGVTDAVNGMVEAMTKSPDKLAELRKELAKFKDKDFYSFTGTRQANIDKVLKQIKDQEKLIADEKMKAIEENEKSMAIRKKKLDDEIFAAEKKNRDEREKKLREENKKRAKERAIQEERDADDYRNISVETQIKLDNQREKSIDDAFKQLEEQDKQKRSNVAGAISIGGSVLQGASGPANLLKGGASLAFGAEIGASLSPIIDALSGGPEATREMVKSFAQAAPALIENIIDAIPVLIEEIAIQIPVIIDRLVERAPMIIDKLIESLPSVINALIEGAPKFAIALAFEAPRIAFSFAESFIKNIPYIVSSFASGLLDALKDIINNLNPFSGDSGGAGGFLSSIGDVFGFAEGGQGFVKQVPDGFPNDSFPARLQSGELIIDRTTTNELKSFLSNSRESGGMSMTMLSKILNTVSSPMNVETSVNFNGKTLADIILQLNRTNQRLA